MFTTAFTNSGHVLKEDDLPKVWGVGSDEQFFLLSFRSALVALLACVCENFFFIF